LVKPFEQGIQGNVEIKIVGLRTGLIAFSVNFILWHYKFLCTLLLWFV